MWQTIEYKSAAIEQFRKGDLLQRVIDDVASEAANAAEMKAAASGNPLILMQVQLASDLRKLEALYSQHQRAQHRLRDRLKWLKSTDERLARAEDTYAQNIRLRDENTRHVTDKGKDKIKVELRIGQNVLYVQDNEKMKNHLLDGIKEVTRNSSTKYHFGSYRGFDVYVERFRGVFSQDGFRLALKGADGLEFRPQNLVYTFEDKLSLAGLFQRMDNFLATGFEEAIKGQREKAAQEKAELQTIDSALGKEFPQKAELELTRENHAAVIRELQRMQDDENYVSEWKPKTLDNTDEVMENQGVADISPDACRTLAYGTAENHTEYTVSNQHNGYKLDGYVLRRVYFDNHVGSIGQSLYEDGQWHTTATVSGGVKLKQFATSDEALAFVQSDAMERGIIPLEQIKATETETLSGSSDAAPNNLILAAGFTPLGRDGLGWEEYGLRANAEDGGIYAIRLSRAGEKVAVKVQYEKDNIVDARKTVKGNFDKVDNALDFVNLYIAPAMSQNSSHQQSSNSFRLR